MTVVPLTTREFARFRDLIYAEAGIRLSDAKVTLLMGRLNRRVENLQLASFDDYFRLVSRDSDELCRMLDLVSTNETRFFRESRQIEFIENVLCPNWQAEIENGERPPCLRIWSAGCSTGEEPYSLAMMLLSRVPSASVEILATDLSTRVLEVARSGMWRIDKSSDIPSEYLKAWMLKGSGSKAGWMKASDEIRSVIHFDRLNLNDPAALPDGEFDAIFCRNVLIYFDSESRRAVIERLISRLAPRGYLFIGHAETLNGVTTEVASVAPTIYRLPAVVPVRRMAEGGR